MREQKQREQLMKLRLPELLDKARREVHKYVKERDKLPFDTFYCPMCLQKKMIITYTGGESNYQACHFHKAEVYPWLRFDLDNIHGGCRTCNYYHNDDDRQRRNFTTQLRIKLSVEGFEDLNRRAKEGKRGSFKYDRIEIIDLIIKMRKLNKGI